MGKEAGKIAFGTSDNADDRVGVHLFKNAPRIHACLELLGLACPSGFLEKVCYSWHPTIWLDKLKPSSTGLVATTNRSKLRRATGPILEVLSRHGEDMTTVLDRREDKTLFMMKSSFGRRCQDIEACKAGGRANVDKLVLASGGTPGDPEDEAIAMAELGSKLFPARIARKDEASWRNLVKLAVKLQKTRTLQPVMQ
jgi:hypothetical protein